MEKALAGPDIHPQWVVKAIELYSEALDLDNSQLEAYLALAVLFWKYGELENAARLLQSALIRSPGHPQATHLLEQIAEDYVQQDISAQISQAADSALSEQNDKNDAFHVSDSLNQVMAKLSPQANSLDNIFSTLNQAKQKQTAPEKEVAPEKTQKQDLLYASVESGIQMHIRLIEAALMRSETMSNPKVLAASCKNFQSGYDRINAQMDVVSQYRDITELEDQFDEFESLLDQLESIIDS